MTKLLLIVGFVLALSTLGFAAANAGAPPVAPAQIAIDGHMVDVDYN
jgi:hypothetical protein